MHSGRTAGYTPTMPRVVLRLPDLTEWRFDEWGRGQAAGTQAELPPQTTPPPLEGLPPLSDAPPVIQPSVNQGVSRNEAPRVAELRETSRTVPQPSAVAPAASAVGQAQVASQPAEAMGGPTSHIPDRPSANAATDAAACAGAGGWSGGSLPDPRDPAICAGAGVLPKVASARRSLRRIRLELHRAGRLSRAAGQRLAALPWRNFFSLAGWLGLLQQPKLWLAAVAAAALQLVAALLFWGGEANKAQQERAAAHAASAQDRETHDVAADEKPVAEGLTVEWPSEVGSRPSRPGSPRHEHGFEFEDGDELHLTADSSDRWHPDVPHTARRPLMSQGGYPPHATGYSPAEGDGSAAAPGPVRLRGIVEDGLQSTTKQ